MPKDPVPIRACAPQPVRVWLAVLLMAWIAASVGALIWLDGDASLRGILCLPRSR
ncbi:MAG: hypothetical protein KGI67_15510 [Pseudomonadota bacterium]|nr:hypothetical protein [Pseudomonadota bacterium]